ncbi:MAG: hypothetical protein AAGC67_08525 [Myxococcota bacterium]
MQNTERCRRSSPLSWFAIAIIIAIASAALPGATRAEGMAARSPSDPFGDTEVGSIEGAGVLELNPLLDVVTSVDQFETVTSVRVDTESGEFGGYAEFAMSLDQLLPVGTTIGATAQGGLTLEASVVREFGAPSGPVDLELELAFDGAFEVMTGQPGLLLTGDLIVTQIQGFFPPAGTIYQSLLTFSLTPVNPAYAVEVLTEGVSSPLGGGASTPYLGAEFEVVSSAENDLDGIVRLTVPISEGETLLLTSLVNAVVVPEPGTAPPSSGVDVRASSGAVDFSNTATLRAFLPEGYSLMTDDPLVDAVVPEPGLGALCSAGIFGLSVLADRGARLRRRSRFVPTRPFRDAPGS